MGARIRRDLRWERSLLPATLAAAAELGRWARNGPEGLGDCLGPLRDALMAAPLARARLAARGLAPSDLRALADLTAFPPLERRELATGWREAAAVGPDDDLVLARSSGSTGEPLTVVRHADEALHMWAVLRFFIEWLGVTLPSRPRVVLLCALPDGVEYSARAPLFHDGALHRVSVRRPDAEARVARVAPAVIFGDPESLAWLAARPALAPRLTLSSALPLAAEQRAALRGPVVNYYSTTETGPIAWECLLDAGRFHLILPDVWVESLGGRLAVTRLRPGAVPLLRYLTGDTGEVAAGRCACGHGGPSITGFIGRRACRFVRADGSSVDAWALAPRLRELPLRAYRVTQRAADDFLVELEGADARAPAELAAALAALGFADARLELRRAVDLAGPAKPEPFCSTLTPRASPRGGGSRGSAA
jgi:phenylacetate-CoA ligase